MSLSAVPVAGRPLLAILGDFNVILSFCLTDRYALTNLISET